MESFSPFLQKNGGFLQVFSFSPLTIEREKSTIEERVFPI